MILKHRDKDLLRFEWLEPQGVRIVSVNERILQIEQFSEKADDVFGATQKVGTVKSVNSESLALQIVTNIKADPFASYEELSDILGIPRRTLARRMKELVSAGLIRRSGAAKNGHWEIVERAAK